ncbi:MltR family transcriptional regulator [Fodinibius halophilus]|uniref:Transcriptional regulator n=1 Tax=Fodinibius halophilus TaxID=1736908 RepID=A0A6M1T2D9_9BACT|nr:MltR family transcriptional regulator [Fodinibius halophilus]NGP90248.1 transcriptional regulator [Fodinibius halophilus]
MEPELKSFSEFLNYFQKESNRGVALTAAAYLDERLHKILKNFLADTKETKRLINGHAPLGSFYSRTLACFSLGLIEKNEFEELTLIRKVRNEFAHDWNEASFEEGKVCELVEQLPYGGPDEFEEESDLRMRFITAVIILLVDLLWRARLVKKEKRKIKTWPNKTRD